MSDGAFSQDDIDTLPAGVNDGGRSVITVAKKRSKGNNIIVVTIYGMDDSVKNASVRLFGTEKAAKRYCWHINNLKPINREWLHASIVRENEKVPLRKPTDSDTSSDFKPWTGY